MTVRDQCLRERQELPMHRNSTRRWDGTDMAGSSSRLVHDARGWKDAGESTAVPKCAFNGKPRLMAQQHVFDDGQPQTGATRGARTRRVHAIEPLRQVRDMLGGNAVTGVGC